MGEEQSVRVDGEEFEYNNGAYVIYVDETVVADSRLDVTVSVYDGDKVIAYATDSTESYVARQMKQKPDDLFVRIMKFSDSAYAYLHRND